VNRALSSPDRCPDCGSRLVGQGPLGGLCPGCLLDLALMEAETVVETLSLPALSPASVTTPVQAGRILGGRYRLLGRLGRGGMGEVWLAFDVKLRVNVALKVLHPELQSREPELDLLRQEVRAARQVMSPHVCRVFDLVEQEGHEMVSMEYVEGVTLARLLAERGPLDLEEAREIAAQFLAGLEAIHRAGLVHRDFKPENVMVTPTGRTLVMDFGLTRSLMAWGETAIAGTPAYMAPEQAAGRPLDARADVFAAAVILAEMVSPDGPGRRDARQRLWRDAHADPPGIPEGPWKPVLLRALSRSAADRFPSAGALAGALERISRSSAGVPGTQARDAEAYECYSRGRKLLYGYCRRNAQIARRMFVRAIEIDPRHALAWAGLADCCSFDYKYWARNEAALAAALGEALESSRKALEFGPDLAEAHVARGLALSLCGQDAAAESEFETALQTSPSHFDAHYLYGRYCFARGRHGEAARLFEKALAVHPEDYLALTHLQMAYTSLRREEESRPIREHAFAIIEDRLRTNPEDVRALYIGADLLARSGDHERALDWADRALHIDPEDSWILFSVACVYALADRAEAAIDCLERCVLAGRGHKEWMLQDPDLDPLRNHPRYRALLDRLPS
jgi:tetratricopeptide (TPR) repeat protein